MKLRFVQFPKISWLMVFAVTVCSTSLLGQDFVWTQTSAPNTNWYSVASSSDGTNLVAVTSGEFANGGIYISTDSGTTWTQTTAPGAGWLSVASSSDGTRLVAASINRTKVDESFVGGIIITSTNSGTTWTQTSAPTNENWQSVASSSDGTKLVAVIGDSPSRIYISTNSGTTWTLTSTPTYMNWSSVASSSDGTKLVAVAKGVLIGYSGIYISTDSGTTWTQTSTPTEQQNWTAVASSSDGTKLIAVASAEDYNKGGIFTSTNSGATWTLTGALDISWHSVASSFDGTTFVAVAAPITYNGGIYISTNSGTTWAQTSAPTNQNWWSVTSSSDGTKLVAVVNYGGGIYTGKITTNSPQILPPSLSLQFLSGYPLLSLYGTLGNTYTVQYTTNLAGPNWTPMLIVPNLSVSPFQMIDPAGVGQPMRFYYLAYPCLRELTGSTRISSTPTGSLKP